MRNNIDTKNKNLLDTTVMNDGIHITKLEQIINSIQAKFINNKPRVAVINLHGVVGKISSMKSGMTISAFNDLIQKAFSIPKLQAVCLNINSPGGSPVQSELIASRIITLAQRKKIPVWSFVEDMAASGGYWLACAGDKIYASKSSVIGSIGVISSSFGFQEAIAKLGIERRIYTQGNNKSILDPFQAVKKADLKIITELQKNIHTHFINFVKERRGGKLTQNDETLFNGEFWTGEIASDFGLIDEIGDMYNVIYEKFGDNVKIEYIAPKQSWLKRKLSGSDAIAPNLAYDLVAAVDSKIHEYKSSWF